MAAENKVVLITGVTSGIGRIAALGFAWQGARLVLGSRSESEGQKLVEEIRTLGASAVFRRTDVTKASELRGLVGLALEQYGRLDVAVNNAGVEATGAIEDASEETFDRIFDTNVKGLWWSMQAEIPALLRSGGGSIINLSSMVGSRGAAQASIYAASKHAVEGLTRSAALELATRGVRVNAVAPGPTVTPMLDRFSGGNPQALAQLIPMKRLGKSEEITHAITWLASEEASFITGAVIPVDGGVNAM